MVHSSSSQGTHTVIEETIEIVFPDSQIVLQSKFS